MKKRNYNMTQGSPMGLILRFSVPILLGSLMQQIYSIVDAVVVGQFVGVEALAGVGATGSLMYLILGFSMGLTLGFTVIVSQRFGAEDIKGMQSAIAMSVYLSLIVSLLLTIVGVLFSRGILQLLDTPSEVLDYATSYMQFVFAGVIGMIFYNLTASILRAVGDSRMPLYFLILSSILNVLLDLLFVCVFAFGTAGVGIATTVSQGLSAVVAIIYIHKKRPELFPPREQWRWNGAMVRQLLRLGLPSAFQNSVTAIGVILMQVVVNGYGTTYVAAYTAASKIQMLALQPLVSIGTTMSTFTGQNLGAGLLKRIRKGVHQGVIAVIFASLLGTACCYFLGRPIALLFVDATEVEVIEAAHNYLKTISPFYFMLGILYVYRAALQGVGNAMLPMMSGFVELGFRMVATVTLPILMGFVGVSLADMVAWIGANSLLVTGYYWQMRKYDQNSLHYSNEAEYSE